MTSEQTWRLSAVPPKLPALLLVAALTGFVSVAPVTAQGVLPALLEIPADVAKAQPPLVSHRAAIERQRSDLRQKYADQNAQCSAVNERDRAKADYCIKTAATLTAAMSRHVRDSKEFNHALRVAHVRLLEAEGLALLKSGDVAGAIKKYCDAAKIDEAGLGSRLQAEINKVKRRVQHKFDVRTPSVCIAVRG